MAAPEAILKVLVQTLVQENLKAAAAMQAAGMRLELTLLKLAALVAVAAGKAAAPGAMSHTFSTRDRPVFELPVETQPRSGRGKRGEQKSRGGVRGETRVNIVTTNL